MKYFLRSILSGLSQNKIGWAFLQATFMRIPGCAVILRRIRKDAEIQKIIRSVVRSVSPDRRVLYGPFRGMQYPGFQSVGSSLFPKLLGCYEREIQPAVEEMCRRSYTEIVDVGCAEGYYAVGFAMRIPRAAVYAFDTNRTAIRLCRRMAERNGVGRWVITGSFCDRAVLERIPFTRKGLIFSDCEGYEARLFDDSVVELLARHDCLIEVHDGLDPSISDRIRRAFERTHACRFIGALPDGRKAEAYRYEELNAYDPQTKYVLLAENRRYSTGWLLLSSLEEERV